MTDKFTELLHSLSTLFGIELRADKYNACALQIKQGLVIQLQPNDTAEKLLIASKITEIPPGKFRENVLKEALKANARPDPLVGTLAYLPNSNMLVLFQYYPLDLLTSERLAGLITPFIDVAEQWRSAILSGQTNPPTAQPVRIPR